MSQTLHDEQNIRAAFDAGAMEVAATRALRLYGHEILNFIGSRLRNAADAEDAFSEFTENVWQGLPKFRWNCRLRTWCYVLAHNAVSRYAASPHRKPERNVRLSCPGVLSELVAELRTATTSFRLTEVKDQFRGLLAQLDAEAQTLIVLRVYRKLKFRDIAITLLGDIDSAPAVVEREAMRLRKVFERLLPELRRLAEAEGLLAPRGEPADPATRVQADHGAPSARSGGRRKSGDDGGSL
jgi:RNA polymerase sigma-70 factor (ECF subfamily)